MNASAGISSPQNGMVTMGIPRTRCQTGSDGQAECPLATWMGKTMSANTDGGLRAPFGRHAGALISIRIGVGQGIIAVLQRTTDWATGP